MSSASARSPFQPAPRARFRPVEPDGRVWASADDRTMIEATVGALELIGAKWKVDLIFLLASGVRRHSRLHDHLLVSKKVLTAALRELERDGLVNRATVSERPRHVEYTLTPLGRSLTAPLLALCEWAESHGDEVEDARSRYGGDTGASALDGSPRFSAAFQLRR